MSYQTNSEPLSPNGVICLDTETTGLSPGFDEILTLSIIDGMGNTLFNEMFKPNHVEEWPQAERINGISPEMVKDCKPIGVYSEQIKGILNNADEILGYNVEFDIRFLEAALKDPNDTDNPAYMDKIKHTPMQDFSQIYGEYDGYHERPKWQKLTTAASEIGYEWTGKAHGSLADSLATLALAKWLYNDGHIEKALHEKTSPSTKRLLGSRTIPKNKQEKGSATVETELSRIQPQPSNQVQSKESRHL